jgi:hypothetical protein
VIAAFSGRVMVIATKHEKEKFLAPLLNTRLGVICKVPETLDTDLLGTFTGEVPRVLAPKEAAKRKCELAMELTHADLALASEGSFGSHPFIPFVPANEEWVVCVDKKNNFEIAVSEISTDTNYAQSWITSEQELHEFVIQCQFPAHALILRHNPDSTEAIHKGITTWNDLTKAYRSLTARYGKVYAETDMRAMHNPMRQQVIMQAATKLVSRLESKCPACGSPGFGVVAASSGLPCASCYAPTKTLLKFVEGCVSCSYQQEKPNPDKEFEDPQYCDECNP